MKRFNRILLLIVLHFCPAIFFAADKNLKEFNEKFDYCMRKMHAEQYVQAIPILDELLKLDSSNANIIYLKSVCLIATNTNTQDAVKGLEYAVKFSSNDYIPSFWKEKHSAIYAHYYLGLGYSVLNKCENAKKSFTQFMEIIGDSTNDYVRIAINRMHNCKEGLPTNSQNVSEIPIKHVDPIYAVQIGTFKKNALSKPFPKYPNLKWFMDNNGTIRVVVGSEKIRTRAQVILESVINKGYSDAFIVDLTSTEKFGEEIAEIVPANTTVSSEKQWEKIEYKVQIGAYKTREKMKEDIETKFNKLTEMHPIDDGWLTLLTCGNFKNYVDASKWRNNLIDKGISDAFIIVFKNGVKISTKEAEKYTSKDF